MNNTTPAIIVKSTFSTADNITAKKLSYSGKIDYDDKDIGKIENNIKNEYDFSGHLDYMGNMRKQINKNVETGLFTENNDNLTLLEKEEYGKRFNNAQVNESPLWQTIVSFDNDFLRATGILDDKLGVDERKLKNVIRHSVKVLQEKETLENALWIGAIHYNTEHIHAHIDMVEETSFREKKMFGKWEVYQDENLMRRYKLKKNPTTGLMEKIPILDDNGNQIYKEEVIGKFKEKSFRAMKSSIYNELVNMKEINIEINNIIRNDIVSNTKNKNLIEDEEFTTALLNLYMKLPENKGIANYKNPIMKKLQPEIDNLTTLYIKKNYPDEYKRLEELLYIQDEKYKNAYGNTNNSYKENKIKDLYYRMGNTILKHLKRYDKVNETARKYEINKLLEKEQVLLNQSIKKGAEEEEKNQSAILHFETAKNFINIESDIKLNDFEINKLALTYLKGIDTEQNIEKAYEYFSITADKGNSYGGKMKEVISIKYAEDLIKKGKVEKGLSLLEEKKKEGNIFSINKLGMIYFKGEVVEENIVKAYEYFSETAQLNDLLGQNMKTILSSKYAKKCFENNEDEKGVNALEEAVKNDNLSAVNTLAWTYFKGEHIAKDYDKAIMFFSKANRLSIEQYEKSFKVERKASNIDELKKELKKKKKVNIIEEKDIKDLQEKYLNMAKGMRFFYEKCDFEEFINLAEYKKATDLLDKAEDNEEINNALFFLDKLSKKGNNLASNKLGMIYFKGEVVEKNIIKAYEYFSKTAKGNDPQGKNMKTILSSKYAKKCFENNEDEKGIDALEEAVKNNNLSAVNTLAWTYFKGEHIAKDYDKAIWLFRKASSLSIEQYEKSFEFERKASNIDELKKELKKQKKVEIIEEKDIKDLQEKYLNMAKGMRFFYEKCDFEEFINLAEYKKATDLLDKAEDNEEINNALFFLDELSKKGNNLASNKLGMIYFKGELVKENYIKSSEYFNKTLQSDNPLGKELAVAMREHIKDIRDKRIDYSRKAVRRDFRQLLQALSMNLKEDMNEHKLNMQAFYELQQDEGTEI